MSLTNRTVRLAAEDLMLSEMNRALATLEKYGAKMGLTNRTVRPSAEVLGVKAKTNKIQKLQLDDNASDE